MWHSIILVFVYLAGVLIHAGADAVRTDRDKPIDHSRGSIMYGTAAIILFIILFIFKTFAWHELIALPLLTRLAFFDPLYNLFIGQNFFYEGVPKRLEDESWWDRQERYLGLPIIVYRLFYLSIYVWYLIIFFNHAQ
jgi:hypothetical protein